VSIPTPHLRGDEHNAIMAAIADRDAGAAGTAMRTRLGAWRRRLLDAY
jgi:DNA-binding GntR family transcriptional regulator